MDTDHVRKISLQEPKSLLERMVKLQEEAGELAQEVLISNKSSGSSYKTPGSDGIRGECADVVLVALSIFFKTGGSTAELSQLIASKSKKWEAHQERHQP